MAANTSAKVNNTAAIPPFHHITISPVHHKNSPRQSVEQDCPVVEKTDSRNFSPVHLRKSLLIWYRKMFNNWKRFSWNKSLFYFSGVDFATLHQLTERMIERKREPRLNKNIWLCRWLGNLTHSWVSCQWRSIGRLVDWWICPSASRFVYLESSQSDEICRNGS